MKLAALMLLAAVAAAANPDQAAFDAALAARKAGRHSAAILGFQGILKRQSDNSRAWYELGLSYARDYQYAKAADAYRLAMAKHYADPACHCALALALRESKQAQAALGEARACREALPAYAGAWNLQGNVQTDLGDEAGALSSYRKAVELRPGYANAQYNLGVTLEGGGQDAESEQAYRQAVLLDAQMVEAWVGLGQVQLRQQKDAAAAANFRKALQIDARNADAEWGLSRALRALGKKADAKEHELRYRRLLQASDRAALQRQGSLKRTPYADEAWER